MIYDFVGWLIIIPLLLFFWAAGLYLVLLIVGLMVQEIRKGRRK